MNMVGKVGSLISQGVYSVATPFHPFGGAVDVIVVEQPDGTYRSTPWYVRFGKFQGVLKGAEKIVRISVNGVEANFHMYLDNSGEAYFVRDIVEDSSADDGAVENSYDSAVVGREDGHNNNNANNSLDGNGFNGNDTLCRNVGDLSNIDEIPLSDDKCVRYSRPDRLENGEVDNDRSSVYEFQDDRTSNVDLVGSSSYQNYEYESLDHVEDVVEPRGSDSEMVLVSVDGHILMAPISSSEENTDNVQLNTPQFHLGPGEESDFNGGDEEFSNGQETWAAKYLSKIDGSAQPCGESEAVLPIHDSNISGNLSENCELAGESATQSQEETQKSNHLESDLVEQHDSDSLTATLDRKEIFKSCVELTDLNLNVEDEDSRQPHIELEWKNKIEVSRQNSPNFPITQEEYACGGDNKLENSAGSFCQNSELSCSDRSQGLSTEADTLNNNSLAINNSYGLGSDRISFCSENYDSDTKDEQLDKMPKAQEMECSSGRLEPEQECSKSAGEESETQTSDVGIRSSRGMGFEISLCGNLLRRGMGLDPANEAFDAHCISEDEFKASASSLVKNENLIVRYKSRFFRWEKAAPIVLGMAAFGLDLPFEPNDAFSVEEDVTSSPREDTPGITSTQSSRRWRLWPIAFRRVKTLQHTNSNASSEEVFVDSESAFQSSELQTPSTPNTGSESPHKKLVRTNVPTTEQIASLNLKDGQNMITFSFSTRVLGTQQVDAHIYLWKWNARIVISDVDGTITRSDVLGQFMPLVGKDWSQSGVAHLFSAIKENGYQLLFLSARAIVQAYLTRSFLLNLKQDGKTLPSGPVVISPDGLFPALYREVIRRAPHEFKIACLEDIKALFPADYNPFYAGFGNRDTDELSYRKIGIPKGKIFIINPKGEVAISHRIDVKSYTSLHTLVNDMFPPTSLVEQEDFNSWNYWKIPLPTINL